MSNIITALLLMAIGYVLYQAGYKDGYDRGYDDCYWRDPEEPEIYMDHRHGGEMNLTTPQSTTRCPLSHEAEECGTTSRASAADR